MQLWLQAQTTEWQVAHDRWTDIMRLSPDEDAVTYSQAIAELHEHGIFFVHNDRAIHYRIVERHDIPVTTTP